MRKKSKEKSLGRGGNYASFDVVKGYSIFAIEANEMDATYLDECSIPELCVDSALSVAQMREDIEQQLIEHFDFRDPDIRITAKSCNELELRELYFNE